jgi:hypothetical protein
MANPPLKTRLVGQATHWSRHPMAPPEYVYECEETEKPRNTPLKWLLHAFAGQVVIVALVFGLYAQILGAPPSWSNQTGLTLLAWAVVVFGGIYFLLRVLGRELGGGRRPTRR